METLSQLRIQHSAPHAGNQIRRQINAEGPAGFARMMEQVFLQQMLKEMHKSVTAGGLFGGSHQAQMYQGMFMEAFADQVAQSGGIGLAEILEEQLQQKYSDLFRKKKADSNTNPELNGISREGTPASRARADQRHVTIEVNTEGDTKDE